MGIRADIQLLELDAEVSLFTLDATIKGGDIFRWHNEQALGGANLTGELVWQGVTYQPRPITVEGLEIKSSGESNRPKLKIANLEALVTGLILDYDDMIGVKVTRKRTLAKYLDGEPGADPAERFADDVYFIIQKESASRNEVVFVLGGPNDLPGKTVPGRKVSANFCIAEYRGEVCQWAGGPVAELNDVPIVGPFNDRGAYDPDATYNAGDQVFVIDPIGVPHVFVSRATHTGIHPSTDASWMADRCSKKLSRCEMTFGENEPLPFDAFVAAARLPQ